MDDLGLLIDFHKDAARQGPGGEEETRLALSLSGLINQKGLRIADIGCGTGSSAILLAEALGTEVIAVDFLETFLSELELRAKAAGVSDRISTLTASMDALPFEPLSLDAIWSEGAIYNIGFEAGIRDWRGFLRPGGILAVSELTWLTDKRPAELSEYWTNAYPEVATAAEKMALLEKHGYMPLGYFPLPRYCWIKNYYQPMKERFTLFLERHNHSEDAQALVNAERYEIDLYERYSDYVSYGFYIARAVG
ncbi:class I SAM-dependent methyltransferase [Coralliovum pocilloporae]|uniref:class I SAM-dependent methyltransferase n=1 Tax=Coralliovum pocilloporae TaxID=3066369 RepID=UPI0033072999